MVLLLVALLPSAQAEDLALVRARAARDLVASATGHETRSGTLSWTTEVMDPQGRAYAALSIEPAHAGTVFHLEVDASATSATPAVFVRQPDDTLTQLGDLSPHAGQASAWIRAHATEDWSLFVLADTAGATGTPSFVLHLYEVTAPDAVVGTLRQTAAQVATLTTGVHTGTLADSDERLADGAPFDTWPVELAVGERLRVSGLSASFDLTLALVGPAGEKSRADSSKLAKSAALLDYTATTAGTHTLGVFATNDGTVRGDYAVIRPEAVKGSVCEVLDRLHVADPWSLDGANHAGMSESHRTRSLAVVAPWASACTVDYFAMDLGPRCTRSFDDEAAAQALYDELAAGLRTCRAGWAFTEEDDALGRRLEATHDGRTDTVFRGSGSPREVAISTGRSTD